MKKLLSLLILVLFLFSFTSSSSATTNRFNIMRFYPDPNGGSFFHVLDSNTLYQFQFAAGMATAFGYRPLEEKNTPRNVVKSLWEDHIYGAIGFTDWLQMSFDLPVAFWNSYIDPDSVVAPPAQWKVNVGDVMIGFRGRILDRFKYPVGLAIAPFVTLPSGQEKYFMGDKTVSGGADLILDAQLGKRVVLALNAGVEVGEKVVLRNIDRGRVQVRLGAGANIRATEDLSFSVEGFVNSPTNHFFSDKVHSPAEVDAGVHYKFGDSGFILTAGGGAGIIRGAGAPLARGFAGITYKFMNEKFRARDAARDPWFKTAVGMSDAQMMIVELREKCPAPEAFDPSIHDLRCPKYYELQDVADLIIKCPSRPEEFNPLKDDERCQKVYTLPDFYSQKEMNVVYLMAANEMSLRCPQPEQYRSGVHDAACPKYYDLVELTDLIKNCPRTPEDFQQGVHDERCQKVYTLKDQFPAANWATVVLLAESDNDGDGVPDLIDRCPNEKGEMSRKGCPAGEAFVAGEMLRTAQPVEFAFNSYALKSEMFPVLTDVVNALSANPQLRIKIEGYADTVGDMLANIWISQMRAKEVKKAIEKMGADSHRISTEGRGATSKFSENVTEADRARNRRVVFIVTAK